MRRFVLGLAIAAAAVLPSAVQADDQQIAEFIKSKLQAQQQAGNLRGFNLDLRVDQGTVYFTGYVADAAQEELVLQTAQQAGHLGATQIVDDIDVRSAVAQPAPVAQQVNYQELAPNSMPNATPMPAQIGSGVQTPYESYPVPAYQASSTGPAPMPMGYTGDNGMGGAPSLPGYVWPGYAAHPNYAAVNYPKQYSPSAWPYIGPFYPYPQVPMGWRRVELEWDDGWWFLDFHDR
ncbi:MAG: BON domain-containing protein [Pirellulaceae bacterium]